MSIDDTTSAELAGNSASTGSNGGTALEVLSGRTFKRSAVEAIALLSRLRPD